MLEHPAAPISPRRLTVWSLKNALRGRRIATDQQVKESVDMRLAAQSKTFLSHKEL